MGIGSAGYVAIGQGRRAIEARTETAAPSDLFALAGVAVTAG